MPLMKLRGKGMVRKIGKSRRSGLLPEGVWALTAMPVLREKIYPAAPGCHWSVEVALQISQIQRRSTTTTKHFELACETSSTPQGVAA